MDSVSASNFLLTRLATKSGETSGLSEGLASRRFSQRGQASRHVSQIRFGSPSRIDGG